MYLPEHFREDRIEVWSRPGITSRSTPSVPWNVSDAPEDYVDKILDAMVGIEITISKLLGKWKVSQNRPADRAGVIQALEELESDSACAMAELVRAAGNSDV